MKIVLEEIIVNSFPKAAVLAACQQYGSQLEVPEGIDGIKLMIAIASNESNIGVNCGPRHEPAYEATGAAWAQKAMAPLLAQYPPVGNPPQSPAACSYGTWQMMFVNYKDVTPSQLLTDLEACAQNFVRFFNTVLMAKHPQTLAEIGEIWNMGHIAPDPVYTNRLQIAYNQA
jgi:hypothetical protein